MSFLANPVVSMRWFINSICTGDGEKAHHLMYTLSAVGINMTPKTILAFIGVVGNNLKSSLINILKTGWWDMYTDLGADALVGKGDSSSTDAKFAYVASRKNIFIMEEVGYQGSVKEKKSHQSGVGGGGGCADVTEDKMSSLDSQGIIKGFRRYCLDGRGGDFTKRIETTTSQDDDEQAPSHKQICIINSKTLDTLQVCIDRAKSGGVWGLVNSALRSVLFLNAAFKRTVWRGVYSQDDAR
ncbi:hypothetical protein O3P69_010427 [Scylla paramamosain]|uniref:Uncharacterized protein n=1 Tax=Scylla paramamosain TaxID=85552 RepID=A0AAW0TVL8_SCYPA